MRSLFAAVAVAAALLLAAFAGRAIADGGPSWKNLSILPKTISKDDLKATMKAQTKALGVDCDHCHEMPDADKDTKNKKIAREMMKMTADLNAKFFKTMDQKVTCETCHRGKEKPEK
jgi:hypothetical protein